MRIILIILLVVSLTGCFSTGVFVQKEQVQKIIDGTTTKKQIVQMFGRPNGTGTDEEGREKLRLMNFEFYGAPCAVFLFMDGSLGEWSIYDMGLFSQNLILAAHALGVESCLQASVTNYAPEIKKFLGLSESKKLVICISLGYPDKSAKLNTYRSVKQKPDEFTRWYE